MVKLIFVRGSPAVGKTTLVKRILKKLKEEQRDCAYIAEDDFRKQMQFKYMAKDPIAHLNSVVLITGVIDQLIRMDHYDYIFLEGQFRYKEVLDKYQDYLINKNFDHVFIQLKLDINIAQQRDLELRSGKSPDIEEVEKDVNGYIPDYFAVVELTGLLEEDMYKILRLLS